MLAIFIGAMIGLAFGGFRGLLIGAAIGYFVRWWLGRSLRLGLGAMRSNLEAIQAQFVETTFAAMGALCKADAVVTRDEIKVAEGLFDRLRLSGEQRQAAKAAFNRGKEPDFDLDAELAKLAGLARGRGMLLQMFLQVQVLAIAADGAIHPAEHAMLVRMARGIGLHEADVARLEAMLRAGGGPTWGRADSARGAYGPGGAYSPGGAFGSGAYRPGGYDTGGRGPGGGYGPGESWDGAGGTSRRHRLDDAYEALGVDASATDAEIKRAYRRLMNENHPDKLASKGLPESMREIAEERTREISIAYKLIKEARGFA